MSGESALVLFGGRSEIGLAIVERLLARQPARVVLCERAGRGEDPDRTARLLAAGATAVQTVDFDAEELGSHEALVAEVFAQGHVSHAVIAFGILGDQERAWTDVAAAQRLMTVNATAATGIAVALVRGFTGQPGERGTLVALSSVAGVRVRRSNFVYGASKAAMDAVCLNLAVAAGGAGPRVVVVRPGVVATRMVAGRPPVALTVTAQEVARRVDRCLQGRAVVGRAQVVHVPAVFTPVMALVPLVPGRLWRRLRG